jgi:hypothetical protein
LRAGSARSLIILRFIMDRQSEAERAFERLVRRYEVKCVKPDCSACKAIEKDKAEVREALFRLADLDR